MKTLQLPPTIRTANPDEVPKQRDILDRIAERKEANIIEGYVIQYNDTHQHPFSFFAEINVDNERLWSLFKVLLLQLPEEICLVYNFKDEAPNFSSYTDKYKVMNKLESYQLEITQDGFLEVGVLYHDEAFLEKIFISSPKYLRVWGVDENRFRQTMLDFELFETPNLNFIDQYPMVTEALHLHYSEVIETHKVLEHIGAIVSGDE